MTDDVSNRRTGEILRKDDILRDPLFPPVLPVRVVRVESLDSCSPTRRSLGR